MEFTLLPQGRLFTGARQFFADAIFPEGKSQRDEAQRAANVDALTGLANRRAFDLAQPTAEGDAKQVIILFDANNFGKVNKVLGHATGDLVLQNMAAVIKLAASRYKLAERAFRLGGDEFVIICPAPIAKLVRDTVEKLYEPFKLADDQYVSLSGTIGSTLCEADQLLQDRKFIKKQNLDLQA